MARLPFILADGDTTHTEGFARRGVRDGSDAIKSARFWLAEIIVGPSVGVATGALWPDQEPFGMSAGVAGALAGVLAVIGLALLVFGWSFTRASFRQRDEARGRERLLVESAHEKSIPDDAGELRTCRQLAGQLTETLIGYGAYDEQSVRTDLGRLDAFAGTLRHYDQIAQSIRDLANRLGILLHNRSGGFGSAKEDAEARGEAEARYRELVGAIEGALAGREPMLRGFVSIRKAVEHFIERRRKGKIDKRSQYAIEVAANILRHCALDGSLVIWGRKPSSAQREPVPRSAWEIAKIDVEDLCNVEGSSGQTWRYIETQGYQPYVDLSVAFSELSVARWPEER